MGHASHTARSSGRALYHYREQLQHKRTYIKELLAKRHELGQPHLQPPLVLIGHSVGALMATELVKDIPTAKLAKCVLLMPTLMHIGATVNGR